MDRRSNQAFQWLAGMAGLGLLSLGVVSCNTQPNQPQANDQALKEKVLQVIRENPQVVIESVQEYQKKQRAKAEQEQQAALQQLKDNPVGLIGDSPTQGAADRKVVLLMFSDFQCPFCGSAAKTLSQFMEKHKNRVTLVYKHFPLNSIHPEATPAAKAAWAAGQQGKFWEYHDALFANQGRLGEELYVETAKSLKLDLDRFNRDRQGQAATEAVEKDLKLAEQLRLQGTPSLFLNGEPVDPQLNDLETRLAKLSPS